MRLIKEENVLFPLVGYKNNDDYQKAKTPAIRKWQHFKGIDLSNYGKYIDRKQWLGLALKNTTVVDIDQIVVKETGEIRQDGHQVGKLILEILKAKGVKFHAIRTPNGYQFIFKHTEDIKNNSKNVTPLGIVADYRVKEKGYIVFPTENTDGREFTHRSDNEELSPVPHILQPMKQYHHNIKFLPLYPIEDGRQNDTIFTWLSEVHNFKEPKIVKLVGNLMGDYLCTPPYDSPDMLKGTIKSVLNQKKRNISETPEFTEIKDDGIEFYAQAKEDVNEPYQWHDIIDMHDQNINEFPQGKFPAWLEDFIGQVSRAVQSPIDMSYALAIGVLSISLTRKYSVKLSNVHEVSLNNYSVVIAPSGERKSATFKPFMKPVDEYEKYIQKESADKIAQRLAFRSSLEVERKEIEYQLKKQYGKTENKSFETIESLRDSLTDINKELQEHPPLSLPLLTIGDVTPEKFSKILSQQNETISIASAESTFFSDFGGAYNSNSKPRQEGILAAYSGDSTKVNRVNEQSDDVSLDNPLANVLVMIQPSVLEGIHEDLINRGLLNRFLFYKPETLVGNRSVDTQDIDQSVMDRYNHYITKMLGMPSHNRQLTLTSEAKRVFKQFEASNEHDLKEGNSLSDIVGWGNRLPSTVIKVAGLMHIAEHIDQRDIPTEINVETLNNAKDFAGYFINQTKSITQMINDDEIDKLAEKLLSLITKDKRFKHEQHINARELKAKVFGRKNEQLKDEALKKLTDHNYIRRYTQGRKKMIEVNPELKRG